MDEVEFIVHEEFKQPLADRFASFMAGLKTPSIVSIDIESPGGYAEVLREMEKVISAKKKEGYVFITNVDVRAYSCALFLFLLGDIRLCDDNAKFLFHSAGFDVKQRITSADVSEMMEVLQVEDAMTDKILSENTKVQPEMLEILKKNDNFLSKEDLIFLGFMDREYELN